MGFSRLVFLLFLACMAGCASVQDADLGQDAVPLGDLSEEQWDSIGKIEL